jgi:hypothetical protein
MPRSPGVHSPALILRYLGNTLELTDNVQSRSCRCPVLLAPEIAQKARTVFSGAEAVSQIGKKTGGLLLRSQEVLETHIKPSLSQDAPK